MHHPTELTWKAGALLVVLLVLTVAPLYVLAGQPTEFVLGIPAWGWLLFGVHFVMLGLVVLLVRELGGVESLSGVSE